MKAQAESEMGRLLAIAWTDSRRDLRVPTGNVLPVSVRRQPAGPAVDECLIWWVQSNDKVYGLRASRTSCWCRPLW